MKKVEIFIFLFLWILNLSVFTADINNDAEYLKLKENSFLKVGRIWNPDSGAALFFNPKKNSAFQIGVTMGDDNDWATYAGFVFKLPNKKK